MDRRSFIAAGSAVAASAVLPARAQAFPEHPIKVLQGFAPGGNADTIARLIGGEMQKGLGQSIVVEAKTGAGGQIASAEVARSKPDGYTLLLATAGHVVAASMAAKPTYRPVDDYEAISTITFFPFLLVVPAGSKYGSLSELLSAARAAPGTLGFASAGVGSTHHLCGELLARQSKAPLLHVPYRGDAASIVGLLAGDVPAMIAPPTAVLGQIQAGKVKALATTGPQRWPGLPDVPTVAEQGVPGFDVRSWAGLLAPAGTPKPIVARLNAETLKALEAPAIRKKLADIGGEARGSTPDEMKAMMLKQAETWRGLIDEAKIPRG
ncbi:MAG: Bug family tripartite tricarboxylate transporter substrate binding protein [Lautropia sp.]